VGGGIATLSSVTLHDANAEMAKIRRTEDPKLSFAFAATRFARQGARESQKQTAPDQRLLVSVILVLPMPAAGRLAANALLSVRLVHWAPAGFIVIVLLRFFDSSILRRIAVGSLQFDSELVSNEIG
jgi:hypothetical protein